MALPGGARRDEGINMEVLGACVLFFFLRRGSGGGRCLNSSGCVPQTR
jgi:hypothetical protein